MGFTPWEDREDTLIPSCLPCRDDGSEGSPGSLSSGSSTEEKPPSKAQFLALSIGRLALGTVVCAVASDPMVDAVSNFSAARLRMLSVQTHSPTDHAPHR